MHFKSFHKLQISTIPWPSLWLRESDELEENRKKLTKFYTDWSFNNSVSNTFLEKIPLNLLLLILEMLLISTKFVVFLSFN